METATPPLITGTFLDEITHDIPTPNSIYPAAHGLYRRYREWQGL